MDERGNIVNYLLNPPDQLLTQEEFINIVLGISQNKIQVVQLKQMTLLKQINNKNQ